MDIVAQIVLSSIYWGPALAILYWVIRLAVRHGIEDAREFERVAARRAAARETIRRHEAASGGSAPE